MPKLMQVDLTKIAKPVKTRKRKRVEEPEVVPEDVKSETTAGEELPRDPTVKKESVNETPEEPEKEETVKEEKEENVEKDEPPQKRKEKKPLTEKQLAAIEKRKQANAEKKRLEEEEIERKKKEIEEKELELKKKKEAAAEKRRLKKAEKDAQLPTVEPVIKYIEKTIEVPRNDAKTRFEMEYERGFRRMGQAVFGRSYQISKRMC